jgi:molecular chaperone DnaK
MYALGIDLGTTYTAAATWRDGHAEIVPLGSRAAAIPSVVLLREDETFLTGEAASRRGLTEPHRVAREFKRRMGDTTPILLGGVPQSAEALAARLLRAVADQVIGREGGAPASICVSYPANWGPYKIDLMRQAVRMADLDGPVIYTTEPEAAAVSYAQQQRIEPGAIVAVYDLGGGTFDAAVLRKTGIGFDILGRPEGIERLGGIDFDAAVFNHVRAALSGKLDELDEDDTTAIAAVARLREECVNAKEALSSDTDTTIPVLLPNHATEVRLTRAEFEAMVRPALYGSVEALKRALRSAGCTPDQLHSILLVGGSSRMPIVAQLVGTEFGRPVAVDAHPKHAVALGASWLASGATAQTGIGRPVARRVPAPPASQRPSPPATERSPSSAAGSARAVPSSPVPETERSPSSAGGAGRAVPRPPAETERSPSSPGGAGRAVPRPLAETERSPSPYGDAARSAPLPPPGTERSPSASGGSRRPMPPLPSDTERSPLTGSGHAHSVPPAAAPYPRVNNPVSPPPHGVPPHSTRPTSGAASAPAASSWSTVAGKPVRSRTRSKRALVAAAAAITVVGVAAGVAYAQFRPDGGGDRKLTGAGTGTSASPTVSASVQPADEQCTDEIKSNPRWVCLTSAVVADGKFTMDYEVDWAGSTPDVRGGFHLHVYGGDGTYPADHDMGSHAPKKDQGDWYVEDRNPSVLGTGENRYKNAIKDAPKVCARIALAGHGLVPDENKTYKTGNCVPITRE